MNILRAKLVITPDNTAPGSEGRICLQLPEDMQTYVDERVKVVGCLGKDGAAMFIVSGEGLKITPRRQVWFKNGVRDHQVRENWFVNMYVLEKNLFVATMVRPTGETAPVLPLRQDTLF